MDGLEVALRQYIAFADGSGSTQPRPPATKNTHVNVSPRARALQAPSAGKRPRAERSDERTEADGASTGSASVDNASVSVSWASAGGPQSVGFRGRVSGFSSTFFGGMMRDSTLFAASREAFLKETEHLRKRNIMLEQLERHQDFHNRVLLEIQRLRLREDRQQSRERRRKQARQAEIHARESDAASRVQKIVRGWLGRSRYRTLRWNEYRYPRYFLPNGTPKNLAFRSPGFREIFERYSLTIECFVRCSLAKEKLQRRALALRTLQRFFRETIWRLRRQRFKRGMVLFQATYRRRIVRQALCDELIDVEVEQEHEREREKRKQEKEANKSRKYKSLKYRSIKKSAEAVPYTSAKAKCAGMKKSTIRECERATALQTDGKSGLGKAAGTTSAKRPKINVSHWPSELVRARQIKKERKQAALHLQKTFRGFKSRKTLHKKTKNTISKGTLEKQDKASRSIQKQFRASLKARKEKDLQDRASKSIQRQFRASMNARVEKKKQDEASRSIQRQFRASRIAKQQALHASKGAESDDDDDDAYSLDDDFEQDT